MDNSEPRSICTFCLNSAFLRLIRLSFSPTSPSALHYYLPALLLRVGANSWPLQGSELTSFLLVVLTGFDTVSFHSVGFEVYFDAVSAQDFTRALRPWLHPSCQWSQQMILPTCRDCSLHVPRRLRKVQDSNLRCVVDIRASSFDGIGILAFVLSANLPISLILDSFCGFETCGPHGWQVEA